MATNALRIVLTGSESTGKTTLARALAARFGWPWVAEFSRGYAERAGRALTVDDVEPIAIGQRAAEDAAIERRPPGLVLDTDLLSTWVYAQHYYGTAPGWLDQAVTARASDLYLLCDIDLAWTPDAVRDRGDRREVLHQAFRDELIRRSLPFRLIGGHGAARLAAAIQAVEELTNR